MRRFERMLGVPAEGAPQAHSHAPLINEPAPRWRDPKDRAAVTMSFAAVDSLRALRGLSPPTPMSFITAGMPASSSSFSSFSHSRVQLSATENDYVAPRSQRGERNASYATGCFKEETQHHQPPQRFPSSSISSSSSDGFARPQQHDSRSRAALQHRFEQHNLAHRGRDYDETQSDESDSSSLLEHERSLLRTDTKSRDSAFPSYHAEHSFASSSPVAPLPLPSLPPPPVSAAAGREPSDSPREATHKPAIRGRRKGLTPEEKRKARTCVVDGCSNYIVHRHRCFRHGGGKRCSVEGCNTSAKQRGLCWRHGGSIICKIDGCTRGVKSKGLCWSHGEGKKLQDDAESAETVYYCIFDDCYNAPVVNSFCEAHSREVTQPGYVYEL